MTPTPPRNLALGGSGDDKTSTSGLDRAWLRAEASRLSNAGRWGADDDLGAWNFVTSDAVRRGVASVVKNKVFSLALPLGSGGPNGASGTGRGDPIHFLTMTGTDLTAAGKTEGAGFADDWVIMNLSAATQWDGFAHVFMDGTTYNDVPASSVTARAGAQRLSVAALRDRVVTRAVLLDVARHHRIDSLEPGHVISPSELDEVCAAQGVAIESGDVVLVRTGALTAVRQRGEWGDYAATGPQPGLGARCGTWLAEHQVAAVATDTYTCEVVPYETPDTAAPLHQILLSRCGITIGEMFDLDELAADCAEDGAHTSLFVAPPLPITGAVNSPINPIAIK